MVTAENKQKHDIGFIQSQCIHEFRLYKQTIQPTNPSFHGTAYYIIRACPKCHKKYHLDYKVTHS